VKLNSWLQWTDEIYPVFLILGQRNDSQYTASMFSGQVGESRLKVWLQELSKDEKRRIMTSLSLERIKGTVGLPWPTSFIW
jgi:hypothetical protein